MIYKDFRDMLVWIKSCSWSVEVFDLTRKMPRSEDYGLTSQVRRFANSVSANIAEGFGRRTNKDKILYYIMARGSAFETQSHLIYGSKVNYFEDNEVKKFVDVYRELVHELNKITKVLNSQPQPKLC